MVLEDTALEGRAPDCAPGTASNLEVTGSCEMCPASTTAIILEQRFVKHVMKVMLRHQEV